MFFNSNLSCSSNDDEMDDLYNELYDSLVKAKKDLKNKLVENSLLHERIKLLEKENNGWNTLVEIFFIETYF